MRSSSARSTETRPCSALEMSPWVTPTASATSFWVRPRLSRAKISISGFISTGGICGLPRLSLGGVGRRLQFLRFDLRGLRLVFHTRKDQRAHHGLAAEDVVAPRQMALAVAANLKTAEL